MYLRRTHGIVAISLRRHFRQRLLFLWHIGEAKRTPYYIPVDQQWWQKHIMLT